MNMISILSLYTFAYGYSLTKNHQDRPKYPELLAQPFIKMYEQAKIDVPGWFQNVMDSAAGKRMRANGDATLTR